jgi:hypothetical protein
MELVDINFDSISNAFEYEKISRSIDSISDIETLRIIAKNAVKLYLAQQELLSQNPLHHLLSPDVEE